jgi:hypothetical protein
MERLGAIINPFVLQPPTQPVAPLQPVAPGSVPVLNDPAAYGYANPVFAAAMDKYIQDKKAAMEAARRAAEAANQGGGSSALATVAIGAGVGYLIVKFLL